MCLTWCEEVTKFMACTSWFSASTQYRVSVSASQNGLSPCKNDTFVWLKYTDGFECFAERLRNEGVMN